LMTFQWRSVSCSMLCSAAICRAIASFHYSGSFM